MLLQISEPGQSPAPHEIPPIAANSTADHGVAIGIDFGTTFSVVAVAREGQVTLLPLAEQDPSFFEAVDGSTLSPNLVPSVLSMRPDGTPCVGHAAFACAKAGAPLITSIKRWLGRGKADLEAHPELFHPKGWSIALGEDGGLTVPVPGRVWRPVEIAAEIMRTLRRRAEAVLGHPVRKAVITVPAYFDDAARTATRDAARLAGLDVLRLLNEPTAAAVAYGLDDQAEGVYAIYDLGGGTFDVSLLELNKGVFHVLATGGDAALGGDDIDHALWQRACQRAGWADQDLREAASHALTADGIRAVRYAKERLATEDTVPLAMLLPDGTRGEVLLTADDVATCAQPWIDKTLACCTQVLHDARLRKDQIRGVVLVGGSTRLRAVQRAVAHWFGREPLRTLNPDEAVARGAARQAEALTAGSSTVLLDVTPLTLGLELLGGVVEPMIHRNSPIPTLQRHVFTTFQNNQTALLLHVVQGEREIAALCRSLAKFELRGIPPLPAGVARIEVTFTLDADGLLTVDAYEHITGVRQSVAVKPSYGLSNEDMIRVLEEALHHQRDDLQLRESIAMRVKGMRLLIAVGEALADDGDLLPHDERYAIDHTIDQLNRALQNDDTEITQQAIQALDAATQRFAKLRIERAVAKAAANETPLPASVPFHVHKSLPTESPDRSASVKNSEALDLAKPMGHSQAHSVS